VRSHFPLLRWLESQHTSDGRPRLTLVAQDARQYIQVRGRTKQKPFDVIVLDAYTSGSTIPPHLMTQEFYGECATALGDDGILISNIIGAYQSSATGGTKYKVLGGAIRAMRGAGLINVHNFPVLHSPGEVGSFKPRESRNNIVLASRQPLDPKRNAAGWERLRAFVPYPELATGRPETTTETILVSDGKSDHSSTVPTTLAGDRLAALRANFKIEDESAFGQQWRCNEASTLAEVVRAVLAGAEAAKQPAPRGWRSGSPLATGVIKRVDWVAHARLVWSTSVQIARDALAHGGDSLTGADNSSHGSCVIRDVPLFTDARPNADIFNTGD
jgi:hypothetical protein